jgi:hypothetical protein
LRFGAVLRCFEEENGLWKPDAARRELVSGIYQCFYYRAHPDATESKTHPAWQYKYACLFAYDASENQSLVKAWETLHTKVKEACWGTANIFVIVLPVPTEK